jgi:hypothetical protein
VDKLPEAQPIAAQILPHVCGALIIAIVPDAGIAIIYDFN